MKIAYLADQIIYSRNILHPEINVDPNDQLVDLRSSIASTTLFQLKEEFENILDRIEENIDLK